MKILRLTVLLIALFLAVDVGSQVMETNIYQVDNFLGGINVLDDSTNLAPNEALHIGNLTFDQPNVLTSRHGYTPWDTAAVDTADEIKAITIYTPNATTKRLVFATNNRVYVSRTLSKPAGVNWDTLALHFHGTNTLKVTNASKSVFSLSASWWLMKVTMSKPSMVAAKDSSGDYLTVGGDSSNTFYRVDSLNNQDSTIILVENYKGADDAHADYIIYKRIVGTPSFSEYNSELYICDDAGFPIVYNDTSYRFLALLDSGTVSDTGAILNDTLRIYNAGMVHMQDGSSYAQGNSDTHWLDAFVGRIFKVSGIEVTGGSDADYVNPFGDVEWASPITRVDTLNKVLQLQEIIHIAAPNGHWHNYQIIESETPCTDTGDVVFDSGKHWLDDDFKTTLFTSMWIVNSDDGWNKPEQIFCNSDSTFATSSRLWTLLPGQRYYIFSRIPSKIRAAIIAPYGYEYMFPFMEQTVFYLDHLYGFGYEWQESFGQYLKLRSYDRVWFSGTGYPAHIQYHDNLDLSDENITVGFMLGGSLYLGTEKGIWRISGIPGDQTMVKVVSNIGIPDQDNWTKASEEYGYFATRDGVYRFNGIRAEKISYKVDRIIQDHNSSRIVMGYFPSAQQLLVSFPDSVDSMDEFTLVYDERFQAWTMFDFGMTAFYAPADTNIFYFGHSKYKGRVFYYPTADYYDFTGSASVAVSCNYQSGWQSYGGYWLNKRLWEGYFNMFSPGPVALNVYADFDSAACDTFSTTETGRYVYRAPFDGHCVGEYFKVELDGVSGQGLIFGGYQLRWTEVPDKVK